MENKIKYPNYDRSILSISSSILKKFHVNSDYPSLVELDKYMEQDYKNIIVMILDCMGTDIVQQNLPEEGIFRKNLKANITTVFPSTTVAATTAFHAGTSAWENGWIGWMPYFKEYNRIIEIFTSKDFYTREKLEIPNIGENILQYDTIYSKIVKENSNVKYHKIFPKFETNGAKTIEEFCRKIECACKTENEINLICAYWDEPDHTIHHNGVYAEKTKEILGEIEAKIEKLTEKLDNTLLVISADHGAVNVEEIYINDYPELEECLLIPPSIEARFVTFFIKEDKKVLFKEKFKEVFQDEFLLFTKEEFLMTHLLGKGKEHYKIKEYLGDFIAISKSNKSIRYTKTASRFPKLIADHAGLTKAEMEVPVIIIDKK